MRQETFQRKPLSEQTIVITGASSGIGLATAKMAAARGARVVLSSRNSPDLAQAVKEIEAAGGEAVAVEADVKKIADLERLRDRAISAFGSIDTWVNNAGTSIYGRLLDLEIDDEKELFETNFWGTRNGCHVAVEAMRKNGGTLINLGSEVSQRAIPLQGIYSATKHAVKAYTDALRMELEKDGIPVAVSLIRPTAIDTPFTTHAMNQLREGEPSLPTPMFHPDVVARAILACAEKPERDVYVGGPSKVRALMDALFPRITDYLLEAMAFDQQSTGTSEPHRAALEAVHHKPAKEGRVTGGNEGKVHQRSLYTEASLHPVVATFAVGASVIAIATVKGFLQHRQNRRAA